MALATDWGCETDSEARARWMGRVLIGKPGGDSLEMGMLKYLAQRMRSWLIHLSLSERCQVCVKWHFQVVNVLKMTKACGSSQVSTNIKLTFNSDRRRVAACVHQAAQEYGHILDLTLLECWGVLHQTISLHLCAQVVRIWTVLILQAQVDRVRARSRYKSTK